MEDRKLIDLFLNRDSSAVELTREKYAQYCNYIASGIVTEPEDIAACTERALDELWNSIPPRNPRDLASYLGRIIRNVSLNYWRQSPAQKRRSSQVPQAMAELGECIPASTENTQPLERTALVQILNQFLANLAPEDMRIFVARYWYLRTAGQITKEQNIPYEKVIMSLTGSRSQLRQMLEGYSLKPGNILSCLEKVDRKFILEFAPAQDRPSAPAPAKKSGRRKLLIPLIVAVVVLAAAAFILVRTLGKKDSGDGDSQVKPGTSYIPSSDSKTEIMDTGDSVVVGDTRLSVVGALYDGATVRLIIKATPASSDIFLIPENITREDSISKLSGLSGVPEGTVEQYAGYLGKQLAAVSFRYQVNGNALEGSEAFVHGTDGSVYAFFTADLPDADSAAISCEASYYRDLEEATDKQPARFEIQPDKAPEPTTNSFETFDENILQESGIEITKLTVYNDGLGCYATFEFRAEEDRQVGILLTDEDGTQLPALPGSDSDHLKSLGDGCYSITVYCQNPDDGTNLHFIIVDYDKDRQYGPYAYR